MRQDLLAQLRNGEITPGTKLPGERLLAQKYGISYMTARKVISGLEADGFLERRRSLGTFVRPGLTNLDILRHNRIIAVVFANLESSISGQFLCAMEARAAKHGYMTVVCNSHDDLSQEAVILHDLLAKNIAGVVLVSIRPPFNSQIVEQFTRNNIPLVCVDRVFHNIEADSIECDNYNAAYRATSYLISLGHRNIGHITIPEFSIFNARVSQERLQGYKQALLDNGLVFSKDNLAFIHQEHYTSLVNETDRMSCGYYPGIQLLSQNKAVTAVFLAFDELAFGFYKAARELGRTIPDDLSVVGLNDLPMCESLTPTLTSMAQPFPEMGDSAIEMLVHRIESFGTLPPVNRKINMLLKTRNSVAPPRI